jgi:hypothetical protein
LLDMPLSLPLNAPEQTHDRSTHASRSDPCRAFAQQSEHVLLSTVPTFRADETQLLNDPSARPSLEYEDENRMTLVVAAA